MCTRCLSCISVRSLSKIEFLLFEKRAKKCIRGFHLGCFPKASAKVRPFLILTKSLRNFF